MIPELPKPIAANIEHFTGRTWLLPTLLEWFEKSDERMFILTGDPGTGKSMIMALLSGAGPSPTDTTAQRQLEKIRSQVKATHFCIAASGTTAPKAFAQNMAEQLTRSVKGFGDALLATLSDRVRISSVQQIGRVEAGGSATGIYIGRLDLGTLGDEFSFDRTFREPLQKLYQGGYKEPMLLLVDALDEAQTYTGSITLVQLLAKLVDLPPQVRILATTRPDPRVLKCFREAKPFDLILDAPPDADDVRLYVDERLALSTPAIDQEKCDPLAKRISEAAEGIFLYAYMVLYALLPRLPNVPDLETYPLPDGLSGLYHDFLNRELGRDENRWYDTFKPVLGLIAVAQGEGLTKTQLQQITGKELEQTIRICKQYLAGDLPEGPFRVFHKSFADFLLDDKENVDYHIDGTSMHHRVVDYYRAKTERWASVDWSKVDEYGLLHLAGHLYALREEPEYRSQLYGLICKPFMEKKLFHFHSHNSFSKDVDLVIQLAASDEAPESLVQLVRACLIYATLGTRATEVPAAVLGILAQGGEGEVAKAIGYAALIQNKAKQSEAYRWIAIALLVKGKK